MRKNHNGTRRWLPAFSPFPAVFTSLSCNGSKEFGMCNKQQSNTGNYAPFQLGLIYVTDTSATILALQEIIFKLYALTLYSIDTHLNA